MDCVTLNNGVSMPILGFGVYQVPPEETERAVSQALEAGYRSIDTAAVYNNEEAVGRAIAASGIPRDDLFVTTKLCLETLDLYLVHQPFGDYYGSWRAMEKLYAERRIRAIGVSNFFPDRLIDLINHNEIVPAVDQVETHPFFQRVADQNFMDKLGVRIESWGPFAEGRNGLFTHPTLTAIGEAHGKSVAQVVLRWLIQRGVVVIPKSVRPERMRENIDVFDFNLSDAEMMDVTALETGKSQFLDHRDPEAAKFLSTLTLTNE